MLKKQDVTSGRCFDLSIGQRGVVGIRHLTRHDRRAAHLVKELGFVCQDLPTVGVECAALDIVEDFDDRVEIARALSSSDTLLDLVWPPGSITVVDRGATGLNVCHRTEFARMAKKNCTSPLRHCSKRAALAVSLSPASWIKRMPDDDTP